MILKKIWLWICKSKIFERNELWLWICKSKIMKETKLTQVNGIHFNFIMIRPDFFSRHTILHCSCTPFPMPHSPLPIYIPCYTIRINHLHLLQLQRVNGPWCGSVRVDNCVTPYMLIWQCWTFRLPHVYNHIIYIQHGEVYSIQICQWHS